MQLTVKTLLNLKEPCSGFVFGDIQLHERPSGAVIEVSLDPRKNIKGICPTCDKKCPGYDRLLHIAKKLNEAIDQVRRIETAALIKRGKDVVLKHSRWCFLKNPENLNDNQKVKLKELLACNLKTIRAHLLKEDFQDFWSYTSATWAGKFLDSGARK